MSHKKVIQFTVNVVFFLHILISITVQVLLGLARYDGDSRRDKATVIRLATTFLKAQQVTKVTVVC